MSNLIEKAARAMANLEKERFPLDYQRAAQAAFRVFVEEQLAWLDKERIDTSVFAYPVKDLVREFAKLHHIDLDKTP